MKIATFNINNINKRLANLLNWLKAARPDVVCLQELKAADSDFPEGAIRSRGIRGGLARPEIVERRRHIGARPGAGPDAQGAAGRSGRPAKPLHRGGGERRAGRLPLRAERQSATRPEVRLQAGMDAAPRGACAAELYATGLPVVLAGDYNVVPTDKDIYPTSSYAKNALLQPESRALFRSILDQGWVDAIRTLHPDEPMYTFWDYMRNRWPRDAGLRLDHLLLSAKAAERLVDAGVDREVRGLENASDHAPAWALLKDAPVGRRRPAAKSAAARKPAARHARPAKSERRPLLAIDGDSFAHRSYHALPKTILLDRGRAGGAILGFANMLLRLYEAEQPRAVLVAWDTLEAPTYRHKKFPAYQSGRKFDAALLEQLRLLPEFVAACGFANARAARLRSG